MLKRILFLAKRIIIFYDSFNLENKIMKAGKKMIHIAVVEDDSNYCNQLQDYLHKFEQETGELLSIVTFSDGIDILDEDSHTMDIILMDIQMKHMDGMKTAERIREKNKEVIIIFITNLSQYALQGYKVEALDYVLKPIQYFAFSQILQKAVNRISQNQTSYLYVTHDRSTTRLDVSKITYVESQGHKVIFHTTEAPVMSNDSLKNLDQKLAGKPFARCNNCYLVNLAYVERMSDGMVTVAGENLQISRPRRKAFMEALADYVGGHK